MHHSTIEDLLISYYDGKATADEIQEIEAWIKLSDENKKKAMDIYTLLLMTDTQQITEKMDMNEELSKVKGRMQENKYHISWWGWIQRAAVALLIPMAITILVLLNQPQSTAPVHAQIFEVRTQPGMITSFRLPDSTLVYLNSGSVLKYPSIFTGNIREVSLNGEAYFEVAKDPEHKFIVSTPQKSKVEVLGTHFNLEAFDEMDEVITTLVEGKVEFVYEKDGQGSKILMRPGQKVIYNNKDGQILSYNTNGESELAWMDQEAQYMEPPARFEAGTQPVAQVVAAGVAAEWLMNIGMENLEAHERTITDELLKMGDIDGIRILGPRSNKERIGTVAFEVEGVHPHDVGQFIDAQGIAIRVGHHCAQPVHRHFGVYASNRASSGIYNSVEDAQALIEALGKVRPFFGVE